MPRSCPHCGQPHDPMPRFCPDTGAPIEEAASGAGADVATVFTGPPDFGQDPTLPGHAAAAAPAGQDAGALVGRAFSIWTKRFVPLAIVAAIGLVPIHLVHGLIVRAAVVPAHREVERFADRAGASAERFAALQRKMLAGEADPAAMREELERVQAETAGALREAAAGAAGAAGGWLRRIALTFLASLLLFGIGLPIVQGALTVAVAGEVIGRPIPWAEAWRRLLPRLAPVVVTGLIVGAAVALGMMLLVLPGLAAAFFFSLAICAVVIEGRGPDAIARSAKLVAAGWVNALVVFLIVGLTIFAAGLVGGLFADALPPALAGIVQGAIAAALFPLGVTALVLVYLDARARLDRLDDAALRAEIGAAVG